MKCAFCQTELPAGARFCMNCGQPVSASSPVDQERRSRLTSAAPAPLVEKVRAAGRLSGERRTVTALFLDVVGSTALAAQLGQAAWLEVLNRAADLFTPIIYRHEGTIAQQVDDELLVFFGAPVAHEDDPVRGVRAALELLQEARSLSAALKAQQQIDFSVRISLSTGPVILGPLQDDLEYTYSALGGTVNLAAQLEAAKLPMAVLISQSTYQLVAPFFDCTDLGTTGSETTPVHIYQVTGQKKHPGPSRGLAGLYSPMVGRQAEMKTLSQLCEAVRSGLGRAALITGEPGLGKTRLIAEWKTATLAHAPGLLPWWIEGRCLSYGQSLAYNLVLSVLRSLLGISETTNEPETRAALFSFTEYLFGSSAPEIYACLGHMLSLRLESGAQELVQQLDPEALHSQYLVSLRRMLQEMASRRPVVLILEDLHWADPSSTELLSQLLPGIYNLPVLICMVTRIDREAVGWKLITAAREVLGDSLAEIHLEALTEADSRQLVSNLLKIDALPEKMRTLIFKKAEGNPLFVEEVIRMFIDRGAIDYRDGQWFASESIDTVEIPDSLQGLLQARIDRLPEDVRYTLRVASVIGKQFPVRVLEMILQGDLLEEIAARYKPPGESPAP